MKQKHQNSLKFQRDSRGAQHGSIFLYGIIALVVVTLVGGVVHSYNRGQKAIAELSNCIQKNNELNGIISRQNDSIRMHEDAAAKAQARSRSAVAAANKLLEASRGERDRLAAAVKEAGSCDSGLAEIRKGYAK